MKKYFLPVSVAAVLVSLFYYSHNNDQLAHQDAATTQIATTTKAGPSSLYPNPLLTPGDVITKDASVVCRKGYSRSVRNVPVVVKRQVYAEYHTSYPQPQGANEVDHFISLELGGSNSIKNLWLEPANPAPGFHEKDKVEDYLHAQVCGGKMTLEEAQKEIATDWYKVYLNLLWTKDS